MSEKKTKIFISHSSVDKEILGAIVESETIFKSYYDIFFTFDDGLLIGTARSEELRRELANSDVMIAIITDSYMRSIICISELSAFWAKDPKKVKPIVYNGERGIKFLEKLFGEDRIFYDVSAREPENIVKEMMKSEEFSSIHGKGMSENCAREMVKWVRQRQENPDAPQIAKPYIGSEGVYERVVQYCVARGVNRIQNKSIDATVLSERLLDKEEIYIVGTTAKGLVGNNVAMLSDALYKGIDVYVMIGNKKHKLCRDVAAIEAFARIDGNMQAFEYEEQEEIKRLSEEYGTVCSNLKNIYDNALKKYRNKSQNKRMGRLFFGNADTLVRQTVTMGINHTIGKVWAWVGVTMPPKRASDDTMSFELDTSTSDGSELNTSLAEQLIEHVLSLRRLAEYNRALIEVNENWKAPNAFRERLDNVIYAREEWEPVIAAAAKKMEDRRQKYERSVLIEIAAQHPLVSGERPGRAFVQRLKHAVYLYEELKREGVFCQIYVPGSLHNGDKISLSQAGIDYLAACGKVDMTDVLSADINQRYKGEAGVYNSADECFVASRIFHDGEFTQLYCVCSANQMMRKKLFYYQFGVVASMFTVPDDSFHSDVREVFEVIPAVITDDHDWQGEESMFALRTRAERKPR